MKKNEELKKAIISAPLHSTHGLTLVSLPEVYEKSKFAGHSADSPG